MSRERVYATIAEHGPSTAGELVEQEPQLSTLAARVTGRWLRARSVGVPLVLDRSRAACAGMDTERFFARGGAWPAKRVCAVCPVVVACLDFALRTEEEYGVFGGATSGERRRIRETLTVTTR